MLALASAWLPSGTEIAASELVPLGASSPVSVLLLSEGSSLDFVRAVYLPA
jgi:hypothetical protein